MQHMDPYPTEVRKKIENYSFSLTDRIGKGYTSIVYKGRNDITSEIVAIKVIDLKSINDHIKKNLLQIQLECMRKNLHHNILRYLDSYETVNNCYIVTQYCDGGDLEKFLRVKGRLSQDQFKGFWRQFYPAYHSFLNAGYLHRDLKPANIFLKDNQIKIADFGMVKKLSENPRDNYNVGTPVYMPPQSLISNIYTEKSDVWSIGVLSYQLTHGTFPWRGKDQRQLKLNIQNTKVVYDYNLISIDLANFITRCLDKNPNTRIGISEMMNDNWVHSVMIQVNGYGVTDRNRSFQRNNAINYVNNQRTLNSLTPVRSYTAPKSISLNHIGSVTLLPLLSVPSLQIIQQHDSKALTNQVLKSQRPTMDSLPPTTPEQIPKRKSSLIQSNRPFIGAMVTSTIPEVHPKPRQKRSPLDYLISILNYLRYVYKVYKFVADYKNGYKVFKDGHREKLIQVLARQLMFGMELQEKMSKGKENIYGINGWTEFVGCRKWATYVNVVQQYSSKYQKLSRLAHLHKNIEKQDLPNTLHSMLFTFHNDLAQQLQPITITPQKPDSLFQTLQLLDYLTTLYQLIKQINEKGWILFIDSINNQKEINKQNISIRHYQNVGMNKIKGINDVKDVKEKNIVDLNQIVECKCVVNEDNWREVWRRLRVKMGVC